ncbi:protein DYAD isoform X1 [Arachis duranensis]|uniref:Protein DYAD isoform X1 n=2 Tax=Arachis duranensis TaxID=130453 RepID=A0A6P5MK24_ARADU|nr:protein DYAD isoform X1 [Arachis duranensis]XP_025615898.1 protein DYAD isoform X1 [Arachis hypogaea]XP_025615899.1 protein DYAD isoform X1 [Arachis hypogaea]XP_052109082.1 protein DYAD isoform X1 [Arachis duranensis]QHO32569.1 Protein DYAD [Arachis hypogaea]
MERLGVRHRMMFTVQHEDEGYESQSSLDTCEDELLNDEEEEEIINNKILPEIKKRKRLSLSELREVKESCQRQSISKLKTHNYESKNRWTSQRYRVAEQRMWEILKAEGATFEHPITRPALRMAARKHISDTGLLDHLLKHIDGKVAPGGTERFRRCFNTNRIMEYWLESADLDKIPQKEQLQLSYRMPPSESLEGCTSSSASDSSDELKLLKIEMAQLKKCMQELIAEQQQKTETSLIQFQEIRKGFVKWKVVIDRHVKEIMASLKDVQGKYGDLVVWKTKVEQQLAEITNKLNDLKDSKECPTFRPQETWKDWIGSSNLDHIHGDKFAPWIRSSGVLNVQQEVIHEDPNSTLPIQQLSEDLTYAKRKQDQPNVTADSSTTVNSKSELDNSLVMFQVMLIVCTCHFNNVYKWFFSRIFSFFIIFSHRRCIRIYSNGEKELSSSYWRSQMLYLVCWQ